MNFTVGAGLKKSLSLSSVFFSLSNDKEEKSGLAMRG